MGESHNLGAALEWSSVNSIKIQVASSYLENLTIGRGCHEDEGEEYTRELHLSVDLVLRMCDFAIF